MINILGHLCLAILLQLIVVWTCGSWFGGAATASAWAISREITQAEYRWIEAYGHGLRANMPWWGGLDLSVWHKLDPWVDWVLPTVATFAIAAAMRSMSQKSLVTHDGGARPSKPEF